MKPHLGAASKAMSLNPGYTAQVRDRPFLRNPGPTLHCPSCRKPLAQGHVLRLYTRCKHCGKWVQLISQAASAL
jgi:phage terminase large subunit GpA-like protein